MKEMHRSRREEGDSLPQKASVIQRILRWVAKGAEKEKKSCQA